MSGWFCVFRKEMREFTRDRRLFFSALLGPLFLEVMIILLFGYLDLSLSEEKSHKLLVINATEGAPVLDLLDMTHRFEIRNLSKNSNPDDALRNKKGRLVLQFPDGFARRYQAREAPEFYVIVDRSETTSMIALEAVRSVVETARTETVRARIRELDLDDKQFDPFVLRAREAEISQPFASEWLVGILPYLIVIWAFYGGFSIVGDLVAGEKERGSLETLLVAPISRPAIAFGKFTALASVSLVACISALAGVIVMALIRIPITERLFQHGLALSGLSVFALIVTVLPLVIFFAGTLLAVSTFARNQREVQGYLSLLSFVVLVPAVFSQFIGYTGVAGAKWIAFVPILNTATVIRDALLNRVDWFSLTVTASVGILLAAVGLFTAVRLFMKESVLMRV
ncbi:MAG: ABC transporter permease [Armatimonadetes bacterium]|nr:ABC transporter permease [Armatimonadota bacterium]